MNRKNIMTNLKRLMVITIVILFSAYICIVSYAKDVNATVSSASCVVGETVTVQAQFSLVASVEAYIQYDTSALEFVSGALVENGALGGVGGGNGRIKISAISANDTTITVNLKFTAKTAGQHLVYVTADSSFTDENFEDLNIVASTGTITATTTAPVSSDNTLKNLTVYIENEDGSTGPGWYWPAFNKDTLEYYLNVENNAKKLAITASANSAKATVSLSDTNLNVGNNNISITVKAEDGSTKTYKLIVTKAEKEQEATTTENNDETTAGEDMTTSSGSTNNVNIGDKAYTIINYNDDMTIPEGYEIVDFEYKGTDIKALKGLGTNIVLIALSDNDSVENFVYNEETDEFYKFITVNVKAAQYVILDMNTEADINIPAGYTLGTVDYLGNIVDAYAKENSSIYIVYAMNWNGEKGLYYFDKDNNTMMKFYEADDSISVNAPVSDNTDEITRLKTQNRIVLIIAITVCLIMLGIILALMFAKKNEDDYDEDEEFDDEEKYDEESEDKLAEGLEYVKEDNENIEEESAESQEDVNDNKKNIEEESTESPEDVNNSKENIEAESVTNLEDINEDKDEKQNTINDDKENKVSNEVAVEDEKTEIANKSVSVKELLEDDTKSLNKDELDMVLDELLSDILDGDK